MTAQDTEPATGKRASATGTRATAVATGTSDITALFVRRPVLAIVVNLLILVGGLAALSAVAIRELPEIDRPVISIRASYDGASAETVDQEVTSVLEAAAGQVSGMKSVSSSSGFGSSRITVEFTSSTDLNVAASDLRDAVGRAARNLPDGIDAPTIVKADSDSQPVLRIAFTSDTMPIERLTALVDDGIRDRFLAVDGVADVEVSGAREQVFEVDVDQAALASRGLTIADLSTALRNVALDVPAGSLTSATQDFTVRATAGLQTPEEFERLQIAPRIRLRDVATVTLTPDDGATTLRSNGRSGIGLGLVRQAGSNTLQISKGARQVVADLQGTLPEGVDIAINSDDAVFIDGAIREVLRSLILATLIVVAVIYLFLLNVRATIIPAITLPVALIGTVAGIWLAGFSINIITLLALVLATGLVVDDAIVVLENIVKKRAAGMPAAAAAVRGTREVFFAVITTTATLAAVFVPLSFLPGTAGGLFREFGFVLAIAVTLSSFVALTLCPMLASKLLAGSAVASEGAVRGSMVRFGDWIVRGYGAILRFCLGAPLVVLTVAAIFAGAAYVTFGTLREELTPPEDRAVALMRVSAPEGVSLDYTESQLRRIEALLEPFRDSGEVQSVFTITGFGNSTNSGFMVMRLAPWDERARSQAEIVDDLNGVLRSVNSVRAFVIQPNSLGIRGGGSGLQIALTGNDYEVLGDTADAVVRALEADPQMGRVRTSYETTQPQLSIRIDRQRASDIGIDITGLATAMQAVLDGREVAEVFVDGDAIPVRLVSTADPVNDPTDLENIFLKAASGRIVPMSSIATIEETAVAPSLTREQKLRAVTITAELSSEIDLREAIDRFERVATPLLPEGVNLLPLAEAATLNETSSGLGLIFGFAIIIVILVLAAQFESFVSAFIIVTIVPLGLACAVFALWFSGVSLNVYSQIGLVLLVGIMAKNGILIVEFANQLRDAGLSVREAAEQAALQRLRPVMMTMVSTVLGGVPLVLSSGAGAEARISLGWVIVGGLGLATLATLFVTPVVYNLLAGLSRPRAEGLRQLEEELVG